MNYENIRSLLDTHLQEVEGFPPFAAENTRLEIVGSGNPYTRSTLLPAEPIALNVSGYSNQYIGLYQVDLFYPSDYGTQSANAMAGAIIDHFRRGLILNNEDGDNVSVVMSWQQTAYSVDQTWYVVPVIIRWASYQ